MKMSNGFTVLIPSIITGVGYSNCSRNRRIKVIGKGVRKRLLLVQGVWQWHMM